MKIRAALCAAVIAAVAIPSAAHAGIADAVCGPGGVVTLSSGDPALLLHPNLWDFEVRNPSINGSPVGFSLSSGSSDYEQFTLNTPVATGQVVEFEFREVRNARENGDGYVSEWKYKRVESLSCPAPPPATTTAPPTTEAAPAPTPGPSPTPPAAPTTAGAPTPTPAPNVPPLPTRAELPSGGGQLPETGSNTNTLVAAGAFFVAIGGLGVVFTRRPRRGSC